MLTTPREKKKLENTEQNKEDEQLKATTVVVEGIVNEMYTAVDQVIAAENENLDNIIENVAEDLDKESDTKAQSTKSSVDRSSVKITNKEKIEMIKALPVARQEEFKTYTQNQAGKKQSKSKKNSLGNKNRKISGNSGEQRKPEKNPRL